MAQAHGENLKQAMDTLRAHKLRSGLTVFGVVLGVSVIMLGAALITGIITLTPSTTPNTVSPLRSLCARRDRKSTRLNSSHQIISYPVFCLQKKKHRPGPQFGELKRTRALKATVHPVLCIGSDRSHFTTGSELESDHHMYSSVQTTRSAVPG